MNPNPPREHAKVKGAVLDTLMDKLLAPLAVAAVIGGVALYGTHLIYGQRIAALEAWKDRMESKIGAVETSVNNVAVDVAYIRGKMDHKP